MNTHISMIVVLSFITALFSERMIAGDTNANDDRPTIALVNRVVEIVNRRTIDADWREAKIGDLLNSGDIIKTGQASFSLVRFYDNSLLRIRELSEVTVYADRDREHYHRNIRVDDGSVGFDVQKKETDRFEFSTPTSVASIRGSTGSFSVLFNGPDVLLLATGLALLRNLISGEEIELTGGEIVFSFSDGTIEKRTITEEDFEQYGTPRDNIPGTERQQRTLEIRTIDENGNPQSIIIEYEEDKKNQ